MNKPHSIFGDRLQDVRSLPPDIIEDLPRLLVNRRGLSEQAFMRTENIIGHVEPHTLYRVAPDGLHPDSVGTISPMPTAIMPPHLTLEGRWTSKPDFHCADVNILGGNGRYVISGDSDTLHIPLADPKPEHFAEYNCRLIAVGEMIRFKATHNLPVTVTSIGKTYVEDYLVVADRGGGAYLEIHDRPHFHMPLDRDACGTILLGKHYPDGSRRISAFEIPFGFGVLTEPWVIHADAFLVGLYMVVYSVAPEFSTVILRQSDGTPARVSIEKHN